MAKRRMRFVTWAKKDPNDETPIRYTVRMKDPYYKTETIKHYTSEEAVSYSTLERIRAAWVESIERVETEDGAVWEVVLYED